MSAPEVYRQVRQLLAEQVDQQVSPNTLERLTLLVVGILEANSASPARVAQALVRLGLRGAKAESLERQIRRIENDAEIRATWCLHPFARQRLCFGRPRRLVLLLDSTTQEDRLVMVTVAVWYRGRSLPLAWAIWPANQPLEGERFWERMAALLEQVKPLLPRGVPVIWVADRAFGCPAFTDLLVQHNWDYVVRVQRQTVYQDKLGRERPIASFVTAPGQRAKGRGLVFKKAGWRPASVVVLWGRGRQHPAPLCLVSSLPPDWWLAYLYRQRFPIEATFRDYKSSGWHWEQGQVIDPNHIEHLLIGMALAMWLALIVGAFVAKQYLSRPPTATRRTRPPEAKLSLFHLGLNRLRQWLATYPMPPFHWELTDWEAPNWSQQAYAHQAQAYIFA